MAMFRSPRDVASRSPGLKKCDKGVKDGTLRCDICFDGWDSETEVAIHRNSAHRTELLDLIRDPNKNVCRICIRPHKDRDDLIRHVKTWHLLSGEDAKRVEREVFICDNCCAIFFNKHLLQAHILIFHTTADKINTYTECPKCYKMYRLKAIWYHFQGHNIQSVACCRICLTKCKDKKDVLQHLETHRKYLYCDICRYESTKETFYDEHILTRHKWKTESSRNTNLKWKPYFMPRGGDYRLRFQCDTPFKGLELSFLDEIKIRICVLCREICLGERSMIDHIQNDHTVSEPVPTGHMCSCGEVFSNKVLLKHHIFKAKGEHRDLASIKQQPEELYTVVLVSDDVDITPAETP